MVIINYTYKFIISLGLVLVCSLFMGDLHKIKTKKLFVGTKN